jgi:hypothetical protein
MAELKTKQTDRSVEEFLQGIADPQRQKDCRSVVALMKKATKSDPKIWGAGIVGFGNYRYKYESGREGDWFFLGFSSRKAALTLYLCSGLEPHKELLARLGKHKTGKGCLYINKLEDVDLAVLNSLFSAAMAATKKAPEKKNAGA